MMVFNFNSYYFIGNFTFDFVIMGMQVVYQIDFGNFDIIVIGNCFMKAINFNNFFNLYFSIIIQIQVVFVFNHFNFVIISIFIVVIFSINQEPEFYFI